MMLRTGTSKNGRIYRYYTCSISAVQGKTVCRGRSVAMDKLDSLVTDHLIERLFKPDRLGVILASLSSRRAEKAESLNGRLIALQQEVTDADEKLKRLYRLVEDGLTDLDEVLKDRLNALKADRDRAKAALERAKEHLAPQIRIDPALIEHFGRTMRENFSTGSVPFRKAYLQALINVIEIGDHQVRIKGSKDLLEKAVLAGQQREPGQGLQREQACHRHAGQVAGRSAEGDHAAEGREQADALVQRLAAYGLQDHVDTTGRGQPDLRGPVGLGVIDDNIGTQLFEEAQLGRGARSGDQGPGTTLPG